MTEQNFIVLYLWLSILYGVILLQFTRKMTQDAGMKDQKVPTSPSSSLSSMSHGILQRKNLCNFDSDDCFVWLYSSFIDELDLISLLWNNWCYKMCAFTLPTSFVFIYWLELKFRILHGNHVKIGFQILKKELLNWLRAELTLVKFVGFWEPLALQSR